MINFEIKDKMYKLEYYSYFLTYYQNDGLYVEPLTRRWFLENVKKDDVVFDIGSHIGLYTVLFSTCSDFVYSFEPTETYENILIPNLKMNEINNVVTEKLAFGNKSGLIEDSIYRIWGEEPELLQYNFTTLDEYCKIKNVIPTIIKIDADGFDYEILLGGINILKENNILICVEINNSLNTRGFSESDIFTYMKDIGYELFMVLDYENHFFKKV